MALIEVKFDPTIDQKDIKIPLVYSSESEGGENYTNNKTESLQTKLYGIVYPLISIDNFIIDYGDILSFSLKSKDALPTLKVTVRDKYGLMEYFDTGGRDNEVNVQIIPRFNDTYKKISLSFFITSKKIQGDSIILTCTYKNKDLLSSQFKALGELSTYETFEQIAKETKLGFASNTQSPQQDNRWMYCNYISYLDLMDREVQMGGDETNIFDYWIDFWNNINYVNMFDRYNNKDKDDDMKVWIAPLVGDVTEGDEVEPYETQAYITNHPKYQNTELQAVDYNIISSLTDTVWNGTDNIYSVYKLKEFDYNDSLVQDGDVKNDIFIKHSYLGEIYTEHDYLKQRLLRETLLKKINSEKLIVTLNSPLLGLMRGDRVNFVWYYNDDLIDTKMSQYEEYLEDSELNIQVNDDDKGNIDNGGFYVDKNISGQYLITSVEIIFNDNKWQYKLTLNRPASDKINFFK